ncbi:33 kDa chaperonin [Picochlorum sp. SENEW3]|nr:33 kDa chaperonin [Picochlorum sp. SENEW3]
MAPGGSRTDEVLRTLSENGQVSIIVVDGTRLVQEACTRHNTAPTASAALGRAILGTLMMSCFRGEGEKTQVTFKGDGPFGMIQVVSESSGQVKGLIGNPEVNFPLRDSDNKLDVSQGVGRGVLSVVRSLPFTDKGWQAPYTGMVPITTGEIAEDLATYLADSEQVQSALGLGVSVGRDLQIDAAGGFLVQVLPFAEEETVAQLELNISKAGSMSKMLKDGLNPKQITDILLEGLGSGGDGFSLQPTYGPCEPESLKSRMASAVAALGEKEVKDIIEEQGHVEVTCEFCKQTYQFTEEQIMEVLQDSE